MTTANEAGVRNYKFAKEEDNLKGEGRTTEESSDEFYVFKVMPVTMDEHGLHFSTEINDCQQVNGKKRPSML